MNKQIEIVNLTSKVDAKIILNRLNFTLSERELVVVMGKNGSGKSTLVHVIGGAKRFTNSYKKFSLLGQDFKTMSPTNIANCGLYISFQQSPMFDYLTISQLLEEIFKYKTSINIDQILEELDLKKLRNNCIGKELSGGEFKRLELLLCICLKPKVIIFDEIDSGVDTETKIKFAQIINSIRLQGTSIACITHDNNFAKALNPDKYYTMVNGKLDL
jgi:FeS assembly ATPase SufC